MMRFVKKLLGLPPSAGDCYEEGMNWEIKAEHANAIASLNEAIRLDSAHADAFYVRGLVWEILGGFDQAIADFNMVLRLNPTSIDCIATEVGVGPHFPRVVRNGPRLSGRTIVASVVEESVPTDMARVHFKRGKACKALGEIEEALAAFSETIRLRPEQQVYFARGQTYVSAARYAEAIADLIKAFEFRSPVVPSLLAKCYREMGDLPRAIAALSESIRLDRTDADNYLARGITYQLQGEHERALDDLNEAIRLDPDCAQAYETRAAVYRALGKPETAANDEQLARELASDERSDSGRHVAPSPQRVAARGLVLAAVIYRAHLEHDPEAESLRAQLWNWIDALELGSELERDERQFLHTPLGHADPRTTTNALWRAEGLGVLTWALGRTTLPAYDEAMDDSPVVASLGFTENRLKAMDTTSARETLQSAELRPASEIARFSSHATVVKWRLTQFSFDPDRAVYVGTFDVRGERPVAVGESLPLEPVRSAGVGEGMDLAAYLRNHPRFKRHWLDGLRLIDSDLALGDKPISRAVPEAIKQCKSITLERQIAAYWLEGDHKTYSKVVSGTILS
jgi:tetratricopeptide (TPR) repeat protein